MSSRPNLPYEDIKIDCYRGLAAHFLTPDNVREIPEYLKNLSHEELDLKAREAVARDFNSREFIGQGIGADAVVLADRCSAVFKIAARYLNEVLPKVPGKNRKFLVLNPSYTLMRDAATDMGWEVEQTSDFAVMRGSEQRLADIREKLIKSNGEIEVLCINSPNNPLCEVYSKGFLEGILNIMREFPNLRVMSDVVYERIVTYNGVVPTLFRLADEELRSRIFEVAGTSKTVMPGDSKTAGYLYTAAENAAEIRGLLEDEVISRDNTHLMNKERLATLISALNDTSPEHYERVSRYYDMARRQVAAKLSENMPARVKVIDPGNLFFLLLDFSGVADGSINPVILAENMRSDYGIRLLPAIKTGSDYYQRLSVGSLFIRKGTEDLPFYELDNHAENFAPAYDDFNITSDLSVHLYIAECITNSVNKLISKAPHIEAILHESDNHVVLTV